MIRRCSISCIAVAAALGGAPVLGAQAPAGPTPAQVEAMIKRVMGATTPQVSLSGRASTEVILTGRTLGGNWFPPAAMLGGTGTIRIDYGQPVLRGRIPFGPGGVEPFDKVWRTGANSGTQLVTDVDLTIGNGFVPAGTYSLYTIPSASGWKLIVNKQTRQWGTDYDPAQDLVRIDMQVHTLKESLDSFTIWLVPGGDVKNPPVANASGMLKMAWGTTEASVPWRAGK